MTSTQKFQFVIGSADDFSSIDELQQAVESNCPRTCWTRYPFELPRGDTGALRLSEIALLVGYGLAFERDWSRDGSVSYLEEVA